MLRNEGTHSGGRACARHLADLGRLLRLSLGGGGIAVFVLAAVAMGGPIAGSSRTSMNADTARIITVALHKDATSPRRVRTGHHASAPSKRSRSLWSRSSSRAVGRGGRSAHRLAVGTVSSTPVPSCPATADSWTGGGGTDVWETAANWSDGVPTSSSYVCITATSATVAVGAADTAEGLLLGTGDSLAIDKDSLTLSGGSGAPDSALQGTLDIASGTTMTVGTTVDLLDATGAAITNQGTLSVSGGFEQDAGTVATGSGDNPVLLANGSSIDFAGSGAGAFQVNDSASSVKDSPTVSLSGNLASGQILGAGGEDFGVGIGTVTVNATASFTNGGTIDLVHVGTGTNGSAVLNVPSGDTLTTRARSMWPGTRPSARRRPTTTRSTPASITRGL